MFFSVAALVLLSASFGLASPNAPFRLRVEYMKNPQGVDVDYKPRLSWALCMYIKLYKDYSFSFFQVCNAQIYIFNLSFPFPLMCIFSSLCWEYMHSFRYLYTITDNAHRRYPCNAAFPVPQWRRNKYIYSSFFFSFFFFPTLSSFRKGPSADGLPRCHIVADWFWLGCCL